MKRYYKGIYHRKNFIGGLSVEFAAVGGFVLIGYVICLLITGW